MRSTTLGKRGGGGDPTGFAPRPPYHRILRFGEQAFCSASSLPMKWGLRFPCTTSPYPSDGDWQAAQQRSQESPCMRSAPAAARPISPATPLC